MALERQEVQHMAILARIALTEQELESFRGQLSQILEQFQILAEVDTSGVSPTGHAAGASGEAGVMRDDIPQESSSFEDVLSNAPRQEGEFFRVKAVLEE
ncbi:MAG: asparaginyl/glutamyl-tRNA amidotransferase subunit C [SAR202 cluster bacterium Io17-Chloro-G9]|nr:MAG: asparaginyl/glutamyl-tRNA amidotransferase subunit C [SAR202 cluster bacterium Io17-Chloro-G9]